MVKISILGWYNHHNLGDEAMLEGLKYILDKKWINGFDVMNGTEPLPEIISRINKSDYFILGGGELIHYDKLYLPFKHWIKQVEVPKMVYGCGVTSEKLQSHVVDDLKSFGNMYVRDKVSQSILEDYNIPVELCLDPSISLINKYNIRAKPFKGLAVIIPTDRKDDKSDAGIIKTNIIQETKQQLKQDLMKENIKEVILLPFGEEDNNDYESCKVLSKYLEKDFNCVILDKPPVKQALKIISIAEKVYSYRLHGCIFSIALNIPLMVFAYHIKILRMLKTLCSEERMKTQIY